MPMFSLMLIAGVLTAIPDLTMELMFIQAVITSYMGLSEVVSPNDPTVK